MRESLKRDGPAPDAVKDLDAIASGLVRELDALDAARETALQLARQVIRAAGHHIRALHRGEEAAGHLEEAQGLARELVAATAPHGEIATAPWLRDALGELVEAALLDAHARGGSLPAPSELGVPAAAYVLGVGDLVGELRRMAVTRLKDGDVDQAERHLLAMEGVTDTLMRFDHPDALVPVRRKQDTARVLLEKTRGEVALARSNKRTQEKVDSVRGLLDRLENQDAPKRAKKKPEDKDLDIDSVW